MHDLKCKLFTHPHHTHSHNQTQNSPIHGLSIALNART